MRMRNLTADEREDLKRKVDEARRAQLSEELAIVYDPDPSASARTKGPEVPAAPFVEIVDTFASYYHDEKGKGGWDVVATRLGVDPRVIYRYRSNRNGKMTFNTADRIVARLHPAGPLGWYTDKKISGIYAKADLDLYDNHTYSQRQSILRERRDETARRREYQKAYQERRKARRRIARGLVSQADVARALGLSRQQVHFVLTGKLNMVSDEIEKKVQKYYEKIGKWEEETQKRRKK